MHRLASTLMCCCIGLMIDPNESRRYCYHRGTRRYPSPNNCHPQSLPRRGPGRGGPAGLLRDAGDGCMMGNDGIVPAIHSICEVSGVRLWTGADRSSKIENTPRRLPDSAPDSALPRSHLDIANAMQTMPRELRTVEVSNGVSRGTRRFAITDGSRTYRIPRRGFGDRPGPNHGCRFSHSIRPRCIRRSTPRTIARSRTLGYEGMHTSRLSEQEKSPWEIKIVTHRSSRARLNFDATGQVHTADDFYSETG